MQGKKPLFSLTVGADEASARATNFGVDFCDLHFGGRVEALPASLNVCNRTDIKYALNFLAGVAITPETLHAVRRSVQVGDTCVLPPRMAPPDSGMEKIKETTILPDGKGKWLVDRIVGWNSISPTPSSQKMDRSR